jgi:hypothetical protein
MTGQLITYKRSSTRQTLTLDFQLTQEKAAELREFIRAYQSVEWKVRIGEDDGTNSEWRAKLTGQSIRQAAQPGEFWEAQLVVSVEVSPQQLKLCSTKMAARSN